MIDTLASLVSVLGLAVLALAMALVLFGAAIYVGDLVIGAVRHLRAMRRERAGDGTGAAE